MQSSEHPETTYIRVQLARVLNATARSNEAELLLREAMQTPEGADTASLPLADTLLAQKKFAETEELLLAARWKANQGRIESKEQEIIKRLVGLYEAWDKPEKAREWRAKLKTTNTMTTQPKK